MLVFLQFPLNILFICGLCICVLVYVLYAVQCTNGECTDNSTYCDCVPSGVLCWDQSCEALATDCQKVWVMSR